DESRASAAAAAALTASKGFCDVFIRKGERKVKRKVKRKPKGQSNFDGTESDVVVTVGNLILKRALAKKDTRRPLALRALSAVESPSPPARRVTLPPTGSFPPYERQSEPEEVERGAIPRRAMRDVTLTGDADAPPPGDLSAIGCDTTMKIFGACLKSLVCGACERELPEGSSERAKLLPLPNSTLLEALDSDLLIRCASYLDADGLARLGRASAAFGTPQAGQQRSLANEAAHQLFRQSATDEERRCLPKHDGESDIGLYRALEQMREPLGFDELAGYGFSPQENPARVTHSRIGVWSTAVSGHVMRGGRHFVEFTIANLDQYSTIVQLGVIRPVSLTNDIDLEADWRWSVNPVYECHDGLCQGTDWDTKVTEDDWQGRELLEGSGTIGLLLDLDEGTLSVFKNNRRLGVMKGGGLLSGEYCWFVSACASCLISMSKSRAPN
ncbi:hypothetical protein THAOC_13488, partial [Thalassiosira oceanica]